MLDHFALGGVELADYTTVDLLGHRDITRIEGLVGLAGPKGESHSLTEQHGATNRNRFTSSKIITVEGECWGTTIIDAFGQFDAVEAALYASLLADAGALATWQRAGGGLALQAYVKLAGGVAPPLEGGAAMLVYQAQLEQMDPRAYSQTLRNVVGSDLSAGGGGLLFGLKFGFKFDESAGGIANVTNGGTIETPPVVRIYAGGTAPLVSPRYTLGSTGDVVKINGTIGVGEYVEVDHAKRAIKLNGTTLRMNLLDTATSTFFDLPVGADTVRLLAQNFGTGAHVEVDSRDAYGG